ncbi:hypothetical protein DMC47_27065 [Nostoc sp. 3335mG]|nr:hypothetical protein DMC47_27065 [Nostoc sp. 3335mG]
MIPSLLSPVKDVRERAISRLAPEWHAFNLADLIELAVSIAVAVSRFEQKPQSYAPPSIDAFNTIQPKDLEQGGRILLSGKRALSELFRSKRQDLTKDPQDITLPSLFGDLLSLQRNYLLPASLRQVLSDVVREDLIDLPLRRNFANSPDRDDGRLHIPAAAKKMGMQKSQVERLVQHNLVPHIKAGYTGATRLVHPNDLQPFTDRLARTARASHFAELMKVSLGCLPLLEHRKLVKFDDALSTAFAPERYYSTTSGKALLDSIYSTVPEGYVDCARSIWTLLNGTRRHSRRWGAALILLHEQPSNFRRAESSSDWRHMSVLEPAEFLTRLDEIPTDCEWLDTVGAGEILGTGWSVAAALGRNNLLSKIDARRLTFTRSSVESFANKYILGSEIMARSTFGPSGVNRGMAELGVEPAVKLKDKMTLIYDRQDALRALAELEAHDRVH